MKDKKEQNNGHFTIIMFMLCMIADTYTRASVKPVFEANATGHGQEKEAKEQLAVSESALLEQSLSAKQACHCLLSHSQSQSSLAPTHPLITLITLLARPLSVEQRRVQSKPATDCCLTLTESQSFLAPTHPLIAVPATLLSRPLSVEQRRVQSKPATACCLTHSQSIPRTDPSYSHHSPCHLAAPSPLSDAMTSSQELWPA